MKTNKNSEPQRAQLNTQRKVSRTKSVRKRLPGCPSDTTGPALPVDLDPNLRLALEFGEAALASATLLSDRLNQVAGDASTRMIRETLKLAQANFDALRARVAGFHLGVGL